MVKKILAIDGGGMYGVVPLAVCIALEERLQKPLRDIFDLFVGTSTGSLIDVLRQAHSLMAEKLNNEDQNEFNTLIDALDY